MFQCTSGNSWRESTLYGPRNSEIRERPAVQTVPSDGGPFLVSILLLRDSIDTPHQSAYVAISGFGGFGVGSSGGGGGGGLPPPGAG